MSLYNERIEVRSTTGGHPAFFAWRDRVYQVRRVIGTWSGTASGHEREAGVRLVRVAAESDQGEANTADITLDLATDRWSIRRVWN